MNYLVLIVQLVIIIYFALAACVLITINNILYRITNRSSQKNKKYDSGVNVRLRWVYFDLKSLSMNIHERCFVVFPLFGRLSLHAKAH